MLAQAGDWVTERNYLVSSLDYLDSPEGRQWDGLLGRINGSLAMWLKPQIDAIRRADPGAPSPCPTATSSWPGCPPTTP